MKEKEKEESDLMGNADCVASQVIKMWIAGTMTKMLQRGPEDGKRMEKLELVQQITIRWMVENSF